MSVAVAVPLFIAALAVTLAAASTFATRLDRLGAKYGLPEVWIGLLTAFAADAPEVSSALVALITGSPHDASTGVIVGSNIFNLAAMIGVSAVLAGSVQIARNTLVLEGTVALAVTAIVIALLLGGVPAVAAVLAIACFVAPTFCWWLAVINSRSGSHAAPERWAIASVANSPAMTPLLTMPRPMAPPKIPGADVARRECCSSGEEQR